MRSTPSGPAHVLGKGHLWRALRAWAQGLQGHAPHTCSLDRYLSTLLFSVFWDMRGPRDSILFRVSSRM